MLGLSSKKIIGFLGLIVVFLFILNLEKEKNYYVINNIEIKKFDSSIKSDSVILLVKIEKKFVSGKNSKFNLLSGSMEKGLDGFIGNIHGFKLYSDGDIFKKSFAKNFIAKNYKMEKREDIGDAVFNLYKEGISLEQIIFDIALNKTYTKGNSFNNSEIFFIAKKDEINKNEIKVDFLNDGKKVNYKIQEENISCTFHDNFRKKRPN